VGDRAASAQWGRFEDVADPARVGAIVDRSQNLVGTVAQRQDDVADASRTQALNLEVEKPAPDTLAAGP
jgi:hypothetical protein